jgi:hypothetical protein
MPIDPVSEEVYPIALSGRPVD